MYVCMDYCIFLSNDNIMAQNSDSAMARRLTDANGDPSRTDLQCGRVKSIAQIKCKFGLHLNIKFMSLFRFHYTCLYQIHYTFSDPITKQCQDVRGFY